MNEHEPFTWLSPPSTTSAREDGKLSGRSSARSARRRQASPLPGMRLYGKKCPVSVTLTIRQGGELWIEVANHEGRFFTNHDASLMELITRVQEGGHWIEDTPSTTRRRRRGKG